ncbi:hypothetical protein EI77_00359 [Prosthecobacter fusiformis]|uniref:Uncharacterized protein n=1 Tax=Prosthecobacter fusiformis TaxID=48464 RepID=A0A4R7SS89_9BACT|nr:hypothetical protein EI77_00359 [Prosthecobacter fusiformis]
MFEPDQCFMTGLKRNQGLWRDSSRQKIDGFVISIIHVQNLDKFRRWVNFGYEQ